MQKYKSDVMLIRFHKVKMVLNKQFYNYVFEFTILYR